MQLPDSFDVFLLGLCYETFDILLLDQNVVSYMNVPCCGALFTNKLSQELCQITKHYRFTKLCACKYSG